jgi:hypothetical protein
VNSAIDGYLDRMTALARSADIDFFPPIFGPLDAWARRHGGRVKPCGAGGGDVVLLLGNLPWSELLELAEEGVFASLGEADRLLLPLHQPTPALEPNQVEPTRPR